jgi:Ca-activated chloride channel family protein
MGGSSIREAKQALSILLKALEPGTFFNIYRFGSTFEHLFDKSVIYDSKQLEAALKYLSSIDADLGGTEILAPLQAIQKGLSGETLTNVVLLTDGEVGNEEQVIDLVRGKANHMRMFTVGIGHGPNEYFIKQLARTSGGAAEMISPNERIEPKVLRLFSKISLTSSVRDFKG